MADTHSLRHQHPVALVTGASGGVGRGIALSLARAGWRVAVNYHSGAEAAAETVDAIRAENAEAFAVPGSVGVASDVSAMVARVIETFGSLSLLVNNAGVQTWAPLLDLTEAEWDRVIDTNLKGCFLCSQAVARHMKDHGGGSIVNIGSGCNKTAFPRLSSYTASKGGIETFTKVSAVELGPYGIRVNCVAPGAIEIPRTRLELPDYAGQWARVTPLRRVGTPEDVGQAVAWLASANASFVTGQTLWVDGGLFSQAPWPASDDTSNP